MITPDIDPPPMWTLKESLYLIPKFEAIAKILGYHVALGGSVMYNGESNKDLDIIVYTHRKNEVNRLTPEQLVQAFLYNKLIISSGLPACSPWSREQPDFRTVISGATKDDKRIDFLFI